MAKLTLNDIANLQNESTTVATLAANNDATEVALEKTLSRDGTSPNTMLADFDMNSYRILNLPEPVSDLEPVRKVDVSGATLATLAAYVTAAQLAETNAELAETNAETAETNAEIAEVNAETAETNAEAAQVAAELAEDNAAASASSASTSASTATTQAGIATTQAGIATTQAGTATTQAGIATTQAGNASTSASTATTQAGIATAAADAAAISADGFDDVYLGSKSSDPTLDNDGNALVEGQLYWNSVSNALKVYDGAAWQSYSSVSGVTGPVSSVDNEIALYSGAGGSTLKRASTTGILKGTSGVISAATAGTDYYNPGGTDVAIADGGTGSSTAPLALTALAARGQGKDTIWIPAVAMWSRTTNGAAAVTRELTTGGDLMIKGWAFDASIEEGVQFYIAMPKSWNKSTITFQPYWTNASGLTTETVSWGMSAGAYSDSDPMDTTDLGTEVRVSDTWLAQNDLHIAAESGSITVENTPADDDLVIYQIVRSVANDNMTGDAELLGVKVHFTTNAVNDA